MAKLILVRHGQSTWNAANRFTGWVDVPLNHVGRQEAMEAAKKISSYQIDLCFTSLLVRALETTAICLTECDGACSGKSPVFKHDTDDPSWHGWDHYSGGKSKEVPIFMSPDLDERYYGELQGFNKAEMAQKVGKDIVHQWRRSFSVRPPKGESLEDTAARTIPFFQNRILPYLKQGDNVLVSAHGNSLRSIIMYLDHLSQEEVPNLELATGIPIVYDIDEGGKFTKKTVLK
ncbi:2,3-bisphosphoglycerate-dependent phosphoglycerate mutase [Aetokthonos hydrillicola Thurmond2011]|uniref:2,3-bisphosphoglycerate-dependent phosphoglycerate mutase n=1 Tax=Aetokthonos hydrillicola Thurmond2011 TaxID=2712845 RepID=A0AAP5MC80_9CYAN|nr:2,3-bisphosphoglycerate-dependent phosphoglycerate mutase [Aetokthonos hydrillicola]MBO3461580.1 2,3-bisphosphoglycerate-dependent phosphoglycerate mutase [Aetokthonos hydrillicola CCALA 1050]MBW4586118.1 2,3-bisphosphoglycerate-dependent phosphoglycerate mutase [Aetokthonos hydrillicola CCALA 1050]MDR9897724.1 2,3-bisphosphoglycerate-dependent phosphoglycerate mutase [Aetokthonos hydrillicola Thurmond2011]